MRLDTAASVLPCFLEAAAILRLSICESTVSSYEERVRAPSSKPFYHVCLLRSIRLSCTPKFSREQSYSGKAVLECNCELENLDVWCEYSGS